MSDGQSLSIGEVINLLRDDFPDVSVSKIRFLESQGLIDPDRTQAGYRQFGPHDVSRLRFILQQQRDHFLPLKVIRSKLTLWERGEVGSDQENEAYVLDDIAEPLDKGEVLKRSKLSEKQLDDLVESGLVNPIPGTALFPRQAAVIAVEAKRLMDHGLEARHLRTLRLSAQREIDLLTNLVAPLLRAANPEARQRAREILEGCSDSVQAIHRALLSIGLSEHHG